MRTGGRTALLFTLAVLAATALAARVEPIREQAGWLYLWPVMGLAWVSGIPGALIGLAVVAAMGIGALGLSGWAALPQFAGVLAAGVVTARLRARFRRAAREASQTAEDALLGWRQFEDRLGTELSRCHRYQQQLALVAVDLDHLGDLRDALDGASIRALLGSLERGLAHSLRASDFASTPRAGELLVALPGLSRGTALAAAERFRAAITKGTWFEDCRLPIVLTASAGVAAFPRDAHNEADLVDAARLALAEAKRRGRDRSVALGDQRLIKAAS